MNKDAILREIKERSGIRSLKLPRDILMEEVDDIVFITLHEGCITKNMQENAAAFEGWVLGVKALFPEWSFCLGWAKPDNTLNGHYQRFLYRVEKFTALFGAEKEGGWFSIADGCSLDDLRITSSAQQLVLNFPTTKPEDRLNESDESPENFLENELIRNPSMSLMNLFGLRQGNLYRQLPMGVFEGEISKETAIFTGGSSAADLWGISADGSLILFELKAKNNNQVGVISELFFYAMVLADEQGGKFFRDSKEGEIIRATESLMAMVLAPEIHPLISAGVFTLLNSNEMGIRFGYVKIDPISPFRCEQVFD